MSAGFENTLKGLPVLVTGHTGFTGGWLCLWLRQLGCSVTGLALAPNTSPSLFEAAAIGDGITSLIGDIRDFKTVAAAFETAEPALVFHLAAQPLVGAAFDDPCGTIATNVLGTAHVLEAARQTPNVKACVCVTTDKVYGDVAPQHGHREADSLGGKDPYSASKACAELVAASYAATLNARGNGMRLATARGGNIIGGGDWSAQRIVPDAMRAMETGETLQLRQPHAVRPWQHVLALVHGYLLLAASLIEQQDLGLAWNFGPDAGHDKTVEELVATLSRPGMAPRVTLGKSDFPETEILRLDSAKARTQLGWTPPLGFDDTARLTAEWYGHFYRDKSTARAITLEQIDTYRATLHTV